MRRSGADRATLLYPFLLAAARVLYQGWHSPGYFTLTDLYIVLGSTLGLVLLVYLVAAAVLPQPADRGLPAFCAFLAVWWLFAVPMIVDELPRSPYQLLKVGVGIISLVLSAVMPRWLGRRPERLRTVATFLTLTGSLLVIRFAGGIAVERVQAGRLLERSALVRELAAPIPGPARVPGPARDLYLIVLDEYANAEVLRDALDFDNRPFLDSLRTLGFTIPVVGSNYTQTMLALPAMLNVAHVAPLAQELGPANRDPTVPNALLSDNRVARFLRARGYRYVFVPSLWWHSTADSPIADSLVRVLSGFSVGRELSETEFRRTLVKGSLLDYLYRSDGWDARYTRGTLEAIGRLPAAHHPVFEFVHVVSPHGPFVFDSDCRLPPRRAEGKKRDQYIGQLQCLNGLVLATVARLIRDSDIPPIILLQGDHGSAIHGFGEARKVEDLTPLAAWERLGAFGAYYLPGGGAKAIGDSVTVVNVMGDVLRHYFGAELTREPDERYLSVEKAPFELRRVSMEWLTRNRFDSTTRFLLPAR